MKVQDRISFTSKGYSNYIQFWNQCIEDAVDNFHFTTSTGRKADSRIEEMNELSFKITPFIGKNILKYVNANDSGLFVYLTTALGILVKKYTWNNKIIFDTPLYRFDKKEKLHVQRVPIFITIDNEKTFHQCFEESKSMVQKCYRYQNYPLEVLKKTSSENRHFSTNVLVVFDKIHREIDVYEEYGWVVYIKREGSEITIRMKYSSSVIHPDLAQNLPNHFLNLLNNEHHLIKKLDILTDEEKKNVTVNFNNTNVEYSTETVVDRFENQAAKTPNNTALISEGSSTSYEELNQNANQLAHYLIEEYAVEKGDLIAVMMDRSGLLVTGILGILKSGAAFLPIDPSYPIQRIQYILEQSNAKLLITDSSNMEEFIIRQWPLIALDIQLPTFTNPNLNPKIPHDADDLAYVIYTSGSTGKPKGCQIQHKNLANYLSWVRDYYIEGETLGNFALFTSIAFDLTLTSVFCPLVSGSKLYIYDQNKQIDEVLSDIFNPENTIDIIKLTPSHIIFLEHLKITSTNISKVIVGGEELKTQHIDILKNISTSIKVINEYGPTEATIGCIAKTITEVEDNAIGKPISNTKIYLKDDSQDLSPIGVSGEIYIAGKGVSCGYLNQPEITLKNFITDPLTGKFLYKTGDLGRWRANGEIEYLGRIDEQVKILGHRIELGEIEGVLDNHPLVKRAVVLLVTTDDANKKLVAYIAALENKMDLTAYLRDKLPEYMIPSHFEFLEEIPLTINGKTDRNQLLNLELSSIRNQTYVAAKDDAEQKLVEIFEQVLQHSPIGTLDNFFSIGFDSLRAISAIVEINKHFNADLRIADIFSQPTVKGIAELIHLALPHQNTIEAEVQSGMTYIENLSNSILEDTNQRSNLPPGYGDIYPLTPIEAGMIYSSMIRPDEPVYYDQFSFQLKIGDYQCFEEAIKELVKRHSILRTRYYMSRFSESVKVVIEDFSVPLTYVDISKEDLEDKRAIIEAYCEQDLSNRLTFEGDLLWHMKVFHLGGDNYYLTWSFHHALLDGWSTGVFKTELSQLMAVTGDISSILPPLVHDYKDYCAAVLGRNESPKAKEFWSDYLSGFNRNKLPFNYVGKRIGDPKSMLTIQRLVEPHILNALEDISTTHNVSMKAIILGAHIYLMHLLSSERDVVTGVVTHDRPPIEDGDKIMGCFLNTIPIRTEISDFNKYIDLVKNINEQLVTLKVHELHLTDIARIVGEKASSGNPIFDCILNYTDFHVFQDWEDNDNLAVSQNEIDHFMNTSSEMTNTLLDLEVDKTFGQLSCRIKYTPDYFAYSEISYALELFERILIDMSEDIERSIAMTKLISPSEKNWLTSEFNNTTTPYSKASTLHGLLEKQADQTPNAVALICQKEEMTYDQLNSQANRLARTLLEKGVKTGDNVGLIVNRGFEMIIGMYAILKSGSAYVPVDPSYPLDRQRYIIENSNASYILQDTDSTLSKESTDHTFIPINDLSEEDTTNLSIAKSSEDLAYTIYTSGSTGRPKGVMIAHHSAVNLIEWVNTTYQIGAKDNLLFITSMCFDLSVYDIFGILSAGGTVVIGEQEDLHDISRLKSLIKDARITFWDSVPTTMNYLVHELETDSSTFEQTDLRLVFMSGDWIPVSLPDRLKNHFPNAQVVSLGGATEGTVWSNYYEINKIGDHWASIPYGRPINNNTFYILDDQQQLVPRGVAGELYIGGVGVAEGYANDEEKTKASFMKDPYRSDMGGRMYKTGDLGRMLPDGQMEFLGRKDHQVKIRGYRVELGEIEHQLEKCIGVTNAVVGVHKDSQGQSYLSGYLISEDADLDIERIRVELSQKLPVYMLPTTYMLLDELPLTSNGKVDRKNLPKQYISEEANNYVSASNELESQLVKLWEQVLGLEKIGITDDFLELGAHSLNIGSFVNRVHRELNVILSLREVFLYPTIQLLAGLMSNKDKEEYIKIEPVAEQEHYEVSHAQKRLWITYQLEEDQIAYNIPGAYHFKGKIDVDSFEKAFIALIDRHESLRTTFITIAGEPRQKIHPVENLGFQVEYVDLRGEESNYAIAQQMANEETKLPFDLIIGPILRAKILQLDEEEHVLLFTMHHIISDGFSMPVFVSEFIALYEAFVKGLELKLPPLRIQYKDYASWQNDLLSGEKSTKYSHYWLNQLSGKIPILDLVTDFERPKNKGYTGGIVNLRIEEDFRKKLQNIAQINGASLFMVLLSSVNTVLYRYSNQEDIIVGTPVAGRDHADLADQIGFYVNLLPLRSNVTGEQKFTDLLSHIKQVTLDAFEHQIYPFDRLVSELKTERHEGRSPLFDVRVELNDVENLDDEFDSIEVSLFNQDVIISHFDLTFQFVLNQGMLFINIVYATDLYKKETVEQMILHLKEVMDQVVESNEISLSEITLSTINKNTVVNDISTSFDFM